MNPARDVGDPPERTRSAPGRFPLLPAGLLALLLLTGMLIGWLGMNRAKTTAIPETHDETVTTPERFASMVIPGFTLLDQDGVQRTRDLFTGRWSILAFTFTNCPTACPIINSNLIRLQDLLKGTDVQTVSITVDPAHDTPEALRAHADRLGIDTGRWKFLTGDAGVIRSIVGSLRFDLTDDPSLPITLSDGSVMNNIVHPTRLLLIGPEGAVHAMESGLEWESAKTLARKARGSSAPHRP